MGICVIAGDHKDLGADEYVPVILVEPDTGGELTYISDQENVTITVDIPPDAFDIAVGLMISPFPPLPPDVMNSPYGSFVAVGPPFGLDVFEIDETIPDPDPQDPPLGDETEEFILGVPAHIVMEYGIEHVLAMKEAMARLELILLSILNDTPTFEDMMAPECGEVEHDLGGQTIDVPICDTGIIPDAAGRQHRAPIAPAGGQPRYKKRLFYVRHRVGKQGLSAGDCTLG